MKYYNITIKPDSQSIMAYETEDEAFGALHAEMTYAYNAKISTTCMVVDGVGKVLKRDIYVKPVQPAEDEAAE